MVTRKQNTNPNISGPDVSITKVIYPDNSIVFITNYSKLFGESDSKVYYVTNKNGKMIKTPGFDEANKAYETGTFRNIKLDKSYNVTNVYPYKYPENFIKY